LSGNVARIALSPNDPLHAQRPHEPSDGAAGNIQTFLLQLPPDLSNAIGASALIEDTKYLDLQMDDVAVGADRPTSHVQPLI